MKKSLALIALLLSTNAFSAPIEMSDRDMAGVVAGRTGYGNQTAETTGDASLPGSGSTNFYLSNAEIKSDPQGISSDVGEGRERADEVNGKDGYGSGSWAYDPAQ